MKTNHFPRKLTRTDVGAARAGRWAIAWAVSVHDGARAGLRLGESTGHGADGENSEDGEEHHFESLVGRFIDDWCW